MLSSVQHRLAPAALLFFCLLGSACSQETENYTVFEASENSEHYANNAVLTQFGGRFWCMWQASATDEDSPDTHILYSSSKRGRRWSRPRLLADREGPGFCSPGGWGRCGDTLVAFLNIFPDEVRNGGSAWYICSADGRSWTSPRPVCTADGKPLDGILEQDPHIYDSLLVGAAHLRPGLHAVPIFTRDLSGRSGWEFGNIQMEDRGLQSRGIEPSSYRRADGALVMLFRDQAGSFRKLASVSTDGGRNWSVPDLTELEDSRSKQCAGNLPDGRAFTIGNPSSSKDRRTLAVSFSSDGENFGPWICLRDSTSLPPQKYPGKYKTAGYSYPKAIVCGNWLIVCYSENKENVALSRYRIDAGAR